MKLVNLFNILLSKNQKIHFLLFFLIFFTGMLLELLGIGLVLPFLELVLNNETYELYKNKLDSFNISIDSKNQLIFYSILLLLFIYTIKSFFLTFVSYVQTKFLYNLKTQISNKLFNIYLFKPFIFHLNNNSALLIRNLNDSTHIMVIFRSLLILLTEVLVVTGVIFLIILLEPYTLSIAFCFGVIGFLFHKKIQTKASEWGKKRKFYEGKKIMNMQQSFSSIKEIKVFGRENFFNNNFNLANNFVNTLEKKHDFVMSLPRIWFEWLTLIIIVLIFYMMMNIGKSSNTIVPILGLFAVAAYRIIPSLTRIMNSVQNIKYSYPAIAPFISEFKDKESLTVLGEQKTTDNIIKFNSEIKFCNVNFKFPNTSKSVFENLSFDIKKGSFVGLLGSSGVGKSTILNIMLGLLAPDKGKVVVDNIDIRTNLKNWQNKIGYVPQNIFLLDDELRKNIALGVEEKKINNDKVIQCLKHANLFEFVSDLKDGINTSVGEFGDRLSGGQKQRIGIARAFYKDPEILILDEFTSSLDIDTEKKIIDELNSSKLKKTIFMISHNPNVLKNCEKLYKLTNNGISSEIGNL
tara:strand:+ start:1250 stop:2980 length:1731 start_codon:yes stop_codon:yes gene_type:complete